MVGKKAAKNNVYEEERRRIALSGDLKMLVSDPAESRTSQDTVRGKLI